MRWLREMLNELPDWDFPSRGSKKAEDKLAALVGSETATEAARWRRAFEVGEDEYDDDEERRHET